ncbi:MAG: hypothetical protein WB508_01990 [Aeromicrobium sp.]|uniref:hypothetical protein n=1 Tax=Aeromicrobium sp. TaxID=1871063 RepID=UPI003C3DD280
MPTLLIEHRISDFTTWSRAFDRFAQRRRDAGVLHERVMQPIDDPHYVLVDLEFGSNEEAQDFQRFLETEVWSNARNSPALVGSPQARIVDAASLKG